MLTASLLLLLLVVQAPQNTAALARINPYGGYDDVVVAIGPDVPPITCQQLVQNIQVRIKRLIL